ncbi:MAG: low molecular weight phosphotyrosine protein phosphatase [Tomitella sp.]|nr:low molecular weight phosphotyrosine protein phosphatase [Tomitella sp.]
MAEKILAHHLQKAGVDGVRVTSAGTGDWHVGDSADHRTETELRTHGYPTEHAAEQLGEQHLSADLVVALDTGHQRAILAQGAPAERVRLLRSFDPEAGSDDVADPYYGGGDGFVTVREQIEAAVPGLLDWARAAVTEAQDRP